MTGEGGQSLVTKSGFAYVKYHAGAKILGLRQQNTDAKYLLICSTYSKSFHKRIRFAVVCAGTNQFTIMLFVKAKTFRFCNGKSILVHFNIKYWKVKHYLQNQWTFPLHLESVIIIKANE